MGIPLTQEQLDDMECAFLERTPKMPVLVDPTEYPCVVSIAGGANPTGLLLSVRLADGAIRTIMLNLVVTQALVRLISVANDEREWWHENGEPYKMPISDEEQAAMHKSVLDHVPPAPGITEYQDVSHVVSLFGGSWPMGMLLNLRIASGDVVGWIWNPIVIAQLFIVASRSADAMGWWDAEGSYILEPPHA